MSAKPGEKAGIRIIDTRETVVFDPERGPRRVIEVRYELPNKTVRSVFIPVEEYSPEEAVRRVREDFQKYGRLIGQEL
jgi:hypothetical protein